MANRRSQRRTTRPVCEALESRVLLNAAMAEALDHHHAAEIQIAQARALPIPGARSSQSTPDGLDRPSGAGASRHEPVRRRVRPERVPVRWQAQSGRHPRFQLQQ